MQCLSLDDMDDNLPVGTILSLWKLPEGWSENWISCDGQIINAGPYVNQVAPDLNNGRRFLRGAPPEEAGHYQDQNTDFTNIEGRLDSQRVGRSKESNIKGHMGKKTQEAGFAWRANLLKTPCQVNTYCSVSKAKELLVS